MINSKLIVLKTRFLNYEKFLIKNEKNILEFFDDYYLTQIIQINHYQILVIYQVNPDRKLPKRGI